MVYYRDPQPGDPPLQSDTSHIRPLGGQLVLKHTDEKTQRSDKGLLDSGYLSDCTVVCGDMKWATHKAILCSRNKWFRAALDGAFEEASIGVVTIKDIDPLAVQVVLDYIYTGATNTFCRTPAKIIEIWKTGDFFGVDDLVTAAEEALKMRLQISATILTPYPLHKKEMKDYTHCDEGDEVKYTLCGHSGGEPRECPVKNVQPQTVFHLREPESIRSIEGVCSPQCLDNRLVIEQRSSTGAPPGQRERDGQHGDARSTRSTDSSEGPAWPDSPDMGGLMDEEDSYDEEISTDNAYEETYKGEMPKELSDMLMYEEMREKQMYEEEIRLLGEALVLATAETPPGSRVHGMLAHHLCNTRLTIMFILCVPERVEFWTGNCGNYGKAAVGSGALSSSPSAADRPASPDDELWATVEIRKLCEALVLATVDMPKGSCVQKALINHMYNARGSGVK